MFDVKYFTYFIFLHLTFATPQINLYYTNWTNDNDDHEQQHDCLRIGSDIQQENRTRRIMSYCLGTLSSKFNIENVNSFSNFTFAKLSKQNITSQQLYLWSAPIDLIENYQFYLNQLSTTNNSILGEEIFYNCTMPRFGPMCQYELPYHHSHHSSLYEIIYEIYISCWHPLANLTCYTHLKCNRGLYVSCLDWTEICDGHLNCLDHELDEEHCWELDINQCKDNEYQCNNGQCIPQSFYQDDVNVPDCIDGSDEYNYHLVTHRVPTDFVNEPTFGSDDKTCDDIPLTSSCVDGRSNLLIQAMLSNQDNSLSDNCLSAFKCFIQSILSLSDLSDWDSCQDKSKSIQIIEDNCPDMFYFPTVPVLFGHIYFAYKKMDVRNLGDRVLVSPYVCYNNSLYDDYFVNASKVLFNNTMCYQINDIRYLNIDGHEWYTYVASFHRDLWDYYQIWKYNRTRNYISPKCNRLDMYQCVNSLRCISKRFFTRSDWICPNGDRANLSEYDNMDKTDTLLAIPFLDDEEIKKQIRYARKHILFQTICDGYTELLLQNETDETECEPWECNNIYTHCNGIWNCFNGEDELNCNSSCPLNHHLCVSPHTNEFICLHIDKANDGKIDCLGATDEPKLCRSKYATIDNRGFYCMNQTFSSCINSLSLCTGRNDCLAQGDDEQFCIKNRTLHPTLIPSICDAFNIRFATDIEEFLCLSMEHKNKEAIVYFSLDKMIKIVEQQSNNIGNALLPYFPPVDPNSCRYKFRCNRGLDLRVWLNDKTNLTNDTCLCPPSYYGDQCQYQNQRISLSIKFLVPSDSYKTPFAIVILLIDNSNERIIHSFEQFSYLSIRDCNIKFNTYLLYSTRPKDSNKNYSIHIDIYDKRSLTHRTSLFFPISFSFLPVHRLAFLIDIPSNDENSQNCSNHLCIHGKCIKYSNNSNNSSFCQCEQGWSGQYCTIQHTCKCSSDSLCLGISAHNRSICICSLHKFGPRCFIDTICHSKNNSICENGGRCIPNDDYIVSDQKFTCICEKGFTGDRCQFTDNKLILSFSKDIVLSQSISIHFIEVITNNIPVRTTILKTIPIQNDSIIIHWSRPFHLIFIEFLDKTYYLTFIQKTYNRSTTIIKTINSSDNCPNINKVLNKSIVQLELVRRIKYYHLPCQTYSPHLQCFYDDIHLCLCYTFGKKRLANCFEFQHNMTFNCFGQNECEKDGQCIQDNPKCPTSSICICRPCYYGRKCQFSTSGSGLSLDAILGYHILPNVTVNYQPLITKMSIALTVIFFILGLINGIVSLITFNNKSICEVGCGLYLLGSSITSLLTSIMFGLKFLILLLAQMTIISNRSFLLFQCRSMDFIVRVCLYMDQWLNACVASERVMTVIKGAAFVKKKSKQAAKFTIIILLIAIIGTCVHDPIYRQLIDEENDDEDRQKRTWCIIRYSSNFEVYNYIINIFHFVGPFLINLISSIILIIKQSRQQSIIHQQRSYKEHLREQCRQHKNLLTAPILLVILAIPRLIITFLSKCMESANDSWLFLVGYFIAFIPPMLTFLIFVLPSKFYRKELRKAISSYRTYIQRRLHCIS